jgi:hypothetical protein
MKVIKTLAASLSFSPQKQTPPIRALAEVQTACDSSTAQNTLSLTANPFAAAAAIDIVKGSFSTSGAQLEGKLPTLGGQIDDANDKLQAVQGLNVTFYDDLATTKTDLITDIGNIGSASVSAVADVFSTLSNNGESTMTTQLTQLVAEKQQYEAFEGGYYDGLYNLQRNGGTVEYDGKTVVTPSYADVQAALLAMGESFDALTSEPFSEGFDSIIQRTSSILSEKSDISYAGLDGVQALVSGNGDTLPSIAKPLSDVTTMISKLTSDFPATGGSNPVKIAATAIADAATDTVQDSCSDYEVSHADVLSLRSQISSMKSATKKLKADGDSAWGTYVFNFGMIIVGHIITVKASKFLSNRSRKKVTQSFDRLNNRTKEQLLKAIQTGMIEINPLIEHINAANTGAQIRPIEDVDIASWVNDDLFNDCLNKKYENKTLKELIYESWASPHFTPDTNESHIRVNRRYMKCPKDLMILVHQSTTPTYVPGWGDIGTSIGRSVINTPRFLIATGRAASERCEPVVRHRDSLCAWLSGLMTTPPEQSNDGATGVQMVSPEVDMGEVYPSVL